MKTLEHWVLRIADSDITWIGLNWLRPAKQKHVGQGYILLSCILCGLPGIAVGAGIGYLVFHRVEPKVWVALVGLVTLVELLLHVVFARYWNRRAERLARAGSTA